MKQVIATDVTIIGGGIAGLWLFRRLNDMGYKTLLLENATLGGGAEYQIPRHYPRWY